MPPESTIRLSASKVKDNPGTAMSIYFLHHEHQISINLSLIPKTKMSSHDFCHKEYFILNHQMLPKLDILLRPNMVMVDLVL